MRYLVPFVITFISNVTHIYLLACYAFIHMDLMQTYTMNKIQFGLIYGVSCVGTIIGTTLFFLFSSKIKQKIITFFSWGCTFFTTLLLSIVLFSQMFEHPHKSILFIIMFFVGMGRCIYFPCLVMITKVHEQIAKQRIDSTYDKLLKSIWSTSFDVGIILGYFACNWLYYSMGWRWQQLILLGSSIHLVANALNYFTLGPYVQNFMNQKNDQKQANQNKQKNLELIKKYEVTIPQMLGLLSKLPSSQLFLLNTTILQSLHLSICFMLPPFFYSIGFEGHQGYLVAIYSIFITIGSSMLGFIDFCIQKIFKFIQQRKQKQAKQIVLQQRNSNELYINNQTDIQKNHLRNSDQREIFLVISSIFLLCFFVVELIMAKDTFYLNPQNASQRQLTSSQLHSEMIKVCVLGFFFGGPIKSYLSYRILMAMKQLELFSQQQKLKLMQNEYLELNDQTQIEETMVKQVKQNGIYSYFKHHKVQLGGAFVATTRITIYIVSVLNYVISFYLIERHINLVMTYLSVIGFFGVLFDIIQDVFLFNRKKKRKQAQQKR